MVEVSSKADFKVSGWGKRHTQCVTLFFTLTVAYSMRSCMGVALVAMVQDTEETHKSNCTLDLLNVTELANETVYKMQHKEDLEVHGFFNILMLSPPYPKFKWPKKTQDLILSSFFWGYMALQIPAGQLAHRFGTRRLLVGAMALNCFIPIVMPILAYYGGWICAVMCRIIQGMGQACIVPGLHTLFGKWTPLEERGRLTSMVYGGQAIGTVLGLPITGFIASTYLGWPGLFRFYGLLSGIIAIVLWFQLADSPAQHTTISFEERRYIEEALGQTHSQKSLPVPWKKILGSSGMLAIIVAHIGNTWGQLTLFSELPSYMDKVMGVNIKANGLLTALPFMVMWFTNFFFSWLTDMMIVKKYLTVTQARKTANSVGTISPCIGLIALAYSPINIYVVETILVLICGFKIAANVGFHKLKTPWKKIWTSMPFISLIVANCAQNWGLWTLMTLMPMYLSQVQGVDIKSNGVMSAIPYMGILIMSFPFGYMADLTIQKKWLSLTTTRKISNSIGTFGPGLALIGLSYTPADITIAVTLLTLVMSLNAGHFTGYLLGQVDMAPNFAGTMSGITNGFANVLSIFAPLSAGFILKDETNSDEWRKVFYLSSGLYIGCNIFYIIFGNSERQAWNEPEKEKSCEST